jgi:hypothetical protein
MERNMSLTKSPYQPLPYIKHLLTPSTITKLIRIRAQSSQIPTHIPAHKQRRHILNASHTETPYRYRYCPFCLPLQHTWGILTPGKNAALGTEKHILLKCKSSTAMRMKATPLLNEALRKAAISQLDPLHPWSLL